MKKLFLTLCLLLTWLTWSAQASAQTATNFATTVSTVAGSAIQLQGSVTGDNVLSFGIAGSGCGGCTAPTHGTITGFSADTGALVYQPANGYTGADTFTFVAISTPSGGGSATPSSQATVTITVSNAKTTITDHLRRGDGTPYSGIVTFVLTKTVVAPDGIAPMGPSVGATLDVNGLFTIQVYPSDQLSPQMYYQVWVKPPLSIRDILIGVYNIPASSTAITLGPYKVTDTNGGGRFTFVSAASFNAFWTTFNSAVPITRTISTTGPLSGGGALSGDLTLTCTGCLTGSGSSGYYAKFTGSGTQGAGQLQDDGGSQIFFSKDDNAELSVRSYGTSVLPAIDTFRARGTALSPTSPQSGDALGQFTFRGLTSGSNYAGGASIRAFAAENFDATHRGTDLYFGTAKNSTNSFYYRLIITNDGTFKFMGETSGFFGLKVAAAAGSTVYTLPSTDGTSGQFIKTDGAGNLSFGTVAGTISGLTTGKLSKAASASTLTDSIITESSGKIGINQASPFASGNGSADVTDGNSIGINTSTGWLYTATGAGYAGIFSNSSSSSNARGMLLQTASTAALDYALNVRPQGASALLVMGNKKTALGDNIPADPSVGTVPTLGVYSSGSSSSGYNTKFNSDGGDILTLKNDGQAVFGVGYIVPPTYSFAGLPASPTAGAFVRCSNCQQTTPGSDTTCTSGGSGSMAFYLNGSWRCFQ